MSCAVSDALILLSFVIGLVGLLTLVEPFHTAPGAFHTRLEFHVKGCDMELVFTGIGPFLARFFQANG